MKLRERAQMELDEQKVKLLDIMSRIEDTIKAKRTIEKISNSFSSEMDELLFCLYKRKGTIECAIRIYELMLENRFEDD